MNLVASVAMRLLVSAVALLVLPAALCSCDLLKRKAGSGGAGGTPPSLAFTPSNLDLTGMDLSKVGDFKVDDPSCTLSSDDLLASCGNGGDVLAFKLAKQADGSPIAVYVARSVHIAPHAVLTVQGKNPVAIVALDSIDIRGHLVAAAGGSLPGSGGHTGVTAASNKAGVGSGGGGAGTATASAGGGGHCGKGGAGALEVGKAGAAGHGGVAYGTPAISPLVGGSAGGTGDPGPGGGGGGAIELVAKTSISVATGGVIQVGGGGGGFGGTSGQGASGGGSGGSILLEAAIVTVAGTLAANGGGGGGGTSSNVPSGADGTGSATPAAGGVANAISPGGSGSASAHIDGANGADTATNSAGGGGGGAGRIRINTKLGVAAVVGATLSPLPTTTCTTQGKLAGT